MMTKATKQCLILSLVVLGLYYPTIHWGGPNSLDDYRLLMNLNLAGHLDFFALFRPGQNFYYRPLASLSFFLDKYLWNLEPSFMLLENVCIHLTNALLVFFLSRRMLFESGKQTEERSHILLTPAFLAGLLFAVHPLATESVNWVSGRTDPLATMFMLLATLLILKTITEESFWYVPVASGFALCGILSKEMSLFFLPVICLLLLWLPAPNAVWPRKRRLQADLLFVLPFLLAGAIFLFYRWYSFHGDARGFSFVAEKFGGNYLSALGKAFTIFGFYVKKLFLPLPLNFAITDISPYYFWIGALLFLICLVLLWRRSFAGRLLVLAFFLTTPAILLGVVKVAWTAYAERYVYMVLPFFAMAITGLYTSLLDQRRPLVRFFPLLILLLCLPVVFQRNLIWTDNLSLYEDTVAKNPVFSLARHELAVALLKQGREEEAEHQLYEGIRLIRPQDEERPQILYATLASIKFRQNKAQEAEDLLNTAMHGDIARARSMVLKVWCMVLRHKIATTSVPAVKKRLFEDLIATYDRLYRRTSDLHDLDMAGKSALESGDPKLAAKYYRDVWRRAPSDSNLKRNANKLLTKLSLE